MSDENKECGCGHDHDGGEHEHEHDGDCDCGGCGGDDGCNSEGCGGGCCAGGVIYINEEERDFLVKLAEIPFLPVTRFIMRSSQSDHMESVALEPVYMLDKADSMETVKLTGAVLRGLEDKNLISLDYDMPLKNYDYSTYEESGLYAQFRSMVQEGGKQEGFLFDQPVLEQGSMALTALGQEAVDSLE